MQLARYLRERHSTILSLSLTEQPHVPAFGKVRWVYSLWAARSRVLLLPTLLSIWPVFGVQKDKLHEGVQVWQMQLGQ
jgi:hypothetical protein